MHEIVSEGDRPVSLLRCALCTVFQLGYHLPGEAANGARGRGWIANLGLFAMAYFMGQYMMILSDLPPGEIARHGT